MQDPIDTYTMVYNSRELQQVVCLRLGQACEQHYICIYVYMYI